MVLIVCADQLRKQQCPLKVFQCLSPPKQEQGGAAVRIRDITETHVSLMAVLVPVCTDLAGDKHHHTSWKCQVF